MAESSFSTVDHIALNIERAMESRRQYFAAPVVSGVTYASPTTTVRRTVASRIPLDRDFEPEDESRVDETDASAVAASDSGVSPFYLDTLPAGFSPPRTTLPNYRLDATPSSSTAHGTSGGCDSGFVDEGHRPNTADSPVVNNHYGVRRRRSLNASSTAVSSPVYYQETSLRSCGQASDTRGDVARQDRDVALRRVELLTAALDEARHQLLDKDRLLEQLSAQCDARDETVAQLQYECDRLQACARRDHLYQTHCALALLSTQEEYARQAVVVSEEKWRLSAVVSEKWSLHEQQCGEALQRWAQRPPDPSLRHNPSAASTSAELGPLEVIVSAMQAASADNRHATCTIPSRTARRLNSDSASPVMQRSASLPVSPRSRRLPLSGRGGGGSSHRHSGGPTDASLSSVKTGLLTEVVTAKKELESDLALSQEQLHREQARCRTRDEEIARLRADLDQERQLSAELQHEVDDMVATELQLRESVARHELVTTEMTHRATISAVLSHAIARDASTQRHRCHQQPQPLRESSPNSNSHLCTPKRQSSRGAVDIIEKAKHTPPNRATPPPPVTPLPSPGALPAIRLRETQLERYKRHMDPFDDSWVGSVDASTGSSQLASAVRGGGTPAVVVAPGTHAAASPVRPSAGMVPGGFSLLEMRAMMEQLFKTHLVPLKVAVDSMRAAGDRAHEQQRTERQELSRALNQLQHLTMSDSGVGTTQPRDQSLVEQVGTIVTDCHATLVQKIDVLQEAQNGLLRQVQETHGVAKKAARILSHNDVVMDGRLKDIVACQSALSRHQLVAALDMSSSPGAPHERACPSASPSQVRSSSQGVSPDFRDAESVADSPNTDSPVSGTGESHGSHRRQAPRVTKQVSFQMPFFDGQQGEPRKASVLEMSRSAVEGTSTSHLITEGEELFRPHSLTFASPPSHIWDLMDSDDESVPPLPTGAGFRTPYDIDSAS